MGSFVISHVLRSENRYLEIEKERKSEKSLILKEFACAGSNIERLTNWMSNIERPTNSGLNIEISLMRLN